MTLIGWVQILVFSLIVLALTRPLGAYMFGVFESEHPPGPPLLHAMEQVLYRLCGVEPDKEQDWLQYTVALLAFSAVSLLITYFIQRLQYYLPANPQVFAAVAPDLAWNTAVSFTTNTNWQAYSGESTMSHLTQMAGLAWHNFTSAGAGIAVALALARGLTRKKGPDGPRTIGNFWVDLVRSILYLLLPFCIVLALFFVTQGCIQTFAKDLAITTLDGTAQKICVGPVASQEAVKMLGTNGGGFFGANSAHPFENPTPLSNLIQMLAIFAIPAGLTYTYGRMAGNQREGHAILAAMAVLYLLGVTACYRAESAPNPTLSGLPVASPMGNMEGKEVRFGISATALFATVTTDASCGAVNGMHESFNPLGGLVPLANIELGEIVLGGVGSGLYGMLIFVLLSVFIAGLMVGRSPEYLGKKIEAAEVKCAMLYILIFPAIILCLVGWAVVSPLGTGTTLNKGPHGLTEILYACSSGAGNNGSAFAGLDANHLFWNLTLGAAMLFGRFWMIVPCLRIAGLMVVKKTTQVSLGTFPTDTALFTVLLLGVVLIVGALTFFPALCLGPIVEHFVAGDPAMVRY